MASTRAHEGTRDHAVLENFVYNEVPRDMARKSGGGGGAYYGGGYPRGLPVFHTRGGVLHSYEMPIGMRCHDGFVALSPAGQTPTTKNHIARYTSFVGATSFEGGVPEVADYARGEGRLPGRPAPAGRPAVEARDVEIYTVSEEVMRNLVQDHWRELKEGGRPHLAFVGVRQRGDDGALFARTRAMIRAMGVRITVKEYNQLKRELAAFVEGCRARRRLEAM